MFTAFADVAGDRVGAIVRRTGTGTGTAGDDLADHEGTAVRVAPGDARISDIPQSGAGMVPGAAFASAPMMTLVTSLHAAIRALTGAGARGDSSEPSGRCSVSGARRPALVGVAGSEMPLNTKNAAANVPAVDGTRHLTRCVPCAQLPQRAGMGSGRARPHEWRGVDHVIDVGGPGTLPQSITAARIGGHIALIGVLTGLEGMVPTVVLMSRQQRLVGLTVGSRQHQEDLIRALQATKIRPIIDSGFPLDDISGAFTHQQAGSHFGKICLEI